MKRMECLAMRDDLAVVTQRTMMDMSFGIIRDISPYSATRNDNTITCVNGDMTIYIDFHKKHATIHERDRPGYNVDYENTQYFIAEIATSLERHRKAYIR